MQLSTSNINNSHIHTTYQTSFTPSLTAQNRPSSENSVYTGAPKYNQNGTQPASLPYVVGQYLHNSYQIIAPYATHLASTLCNSSAVSSIMDYIPRLFGAEASPSSNLAPMSPKDIDKLYELAKKHNIVFPDGQNPELVSGDLMTLGVTHGPNGESMADTMTHMIHTNNLDPFLKDIVTHTDILPILLMEGGNIDIDDSTRTSLITAYKTKKNYFRYLKDMASEQLKKETVYECLASKYTVITTNESISISLTIDFFARENALQNYFNQKRDTSLLEEQEHWRSYLNSHLSPPVLLIGIRGNGHALHNRTSSIFRNGGQLFAQSHSAAQEEANSNIERAVQTPTAKAYISKHADKIAKASDTLYRHCLGLEKNDASELRQEF